MKSFAGILLIFLSLLTLSCSTTKKETDNSKNKESQLITLPSGIKYSEIKEGSGKSPKYGQKVTVNFILSTENNTIVENTYASGQPLSFRIGKDEVISGLEEAVISMKEGGKRKVIVPPEMAFGNRAIRSLPPNATLIFELELLKVE